MGIVLRATTFEGGTTELAKLTGEHLTCNEGGAGSIPVASSKRFVAGYNQPEDGAAHNRADVGSIPTPATIIFVKPEHKQAPVRPTFIDARGIPANSPVGKIAFTVTQPDQRSL